MWWVQANEFDDSELFRSEEEAERYARDEYSTYIELAEEAGEEDEDEEGE